jgi:hypothetical protein
VERLFELIARHVDRVLPSGDTWHRDLLYQMAGDLPEARPAVVSQETAQALDEYRRFRHVVRQWTCLPTSLPLPTATFLA